MKIFYWVGMVIGLAVFLWPSSYILKMKKYTERELEKISPQYKAINKAYLKHGIWGATIFIPILLILVFIITNFEVEQSTNIMSAYIVVVFSAASIFYGVFAVKKGVYPTSKYFGSKTTYAFDENNGIERYGRLQIKISVGVGILAMMVVVVLMLLNLK